MGMEINLIGWTFFKICIALFIAFGALAAYISYEEYEDNLVDFLISLSILVFILGFVDMIFNILGIKLLLFLPALH